MDAERPHPGSVPHHGLRTRAAPDPTEPGSFMVLGPGELPPPYPERDEVWILGHVLSREPIPYSWELCGLYSTRAAAIAACGGRPDCFLAPLQLDAAPPVGTKTFPRCEWIHNPQPPTARGFTP
jgi:hypothetical protein